MNAITSIRYSPSYPHYKLLAFTGLLYSAIVVASYSLKFMLTYRNDYFPGFRRHGLRYPKKKNILSTNWPNSSVTTTIGSIFANILLLRNCLVFHISVLYHYVYLQWRSFNPLSWNDESDSSYNFLPFFIHCRSIVYITIYKK